MLLLFLALTVQPGFFNILVSIILSINSRRAESFVAVLRRRKKGGVSSSSSSSANKMNVTTVLSRGGLTSLYLTGVCMCVGLFTFIIKYRNSNRKKK